MGIFLATDAYIYAFHITAGREEADRNGIHQFVEYITNAEPAFDRTTARLYGVMNANQRPNGNDLLSRCAEQLGVGQCTPVKLMDLPKTQCGGRLAAAVICRRVGTEIQLMYKPNQPDLWTPGAGDLRGGVHDYALEDDSRLSTVVDDTWITVGGGWWVSSCALL